MKPAILGAAALAAAFSPIVASAQHAPITLTETYGQWVTNHAAGMGDVTVINLSGADSYVWVLDGSGRLVGVAHLDPTPCEDAATCTDGSELSMATLPGAYTVLVAPLTDVPVLSRTVTVAADQWTELDVQEW